MPQTKINPVILIGGSGTRLWPMSRINYPKQFNKFSGEYSLFQQTVLRVKNLPSLGKMTLVVGESNYFLCLDQLHELDIHDANIIVEPMGKNTLPAIAVSAQCIQQSNDHLMLVLASDHHIKNENAFIETVEKACAHANDRLILFGIKPNAPATGYGYIQALETATPPTKVEKFLEKPNLERAKELIALPDCYWNSGMFFFSSDTILREIEKYAPDVNALAKQSLEAGIQQGNTIYLNRNTFSQMPSTPIDIAIMEKTDNAYVFPLESDWSDLGDWNAVYDSKVADEHGNVSVGRVVSLSTKNSYLHSSDKLLTTIGVDNLVVVASKDSVLVADKSHAQHVKNLVELLKESEFSEHAHNDSKVYRPWGSYESVVNLNNFQVKHIIVKPGGKLSLQMHHQRSEHWVVVKGVADVICGEHAFKVHENESTYIPKHTKHRLLNLQHTPLHIIEVQVGDYLGEDDIIRFDDVYGRVAESV